MSNSTTTNSGTGALLLILALIAAFVGAIAADNYHMPKYKKQFMKLEKERVALANKLATAEIMQKNLNHVRDLIFSNMDFPDQPDSVDHETQFFNFVTTCVNDLKLKLVSVKPITPVIEGRITTYAYDVEVEGDFFRFGELCAKFENNRRIVSIESFDVDLLSDQRRGYEGLQSDSKSGKKKDPKNDGQDIRIKMRINTYRVSKGPEAVVVQPPPKKR